MRSKTLMTNNSNMNDKVKTPDDLFESSWEVCNKVGGIYTVLSTKAHTLQQLLNDKVIFIGPDVWGDKTAPDFVADDRLFADWCAHAEAVDQLKVKVGRWNVPGNPPVILVDFKPFFKERDSFFYTMWEYFRVDSIHAYGDYDESCIFALAVGKVMESFYHFYHLEQKQVVGLFNEWMLAMGALYIQQHIPAIATIFTTHATSIGRSIAGNNKALYAYMDGYNGDQMARELNMEAKHSVEKQAAHHVDCFTTVSDITARECKQLLDKEPDIVTPNGFEPNFVPEIKVYKQKRAAARAALLNVAEKLTGCAIDPDALLVSTSGRYEYRNKGIDVFIEAMNRVRTSGRLQRELVAFIMVPAWTRAPRADLKEVLEQKAEIQKCLLSAKKIGLESDMNLIFLPGGEPIEDGSELLSSDRMRRILQIVEKWADYVILDSAPAGLLTDAVVLAQYADAALFVVRKDFARVNYIMDGLEHLAESRIQIVGGILNGV